MGKGGEKMALQVVENGGDGGKVADSKGADKTYVSGENAPEVAATVNRMRFMIQMILIIAQKLRG
jgi:hypothetical protein